MVVDVGGGTSEVAVISLGRIVVSRSLRVGGYDLDDAITAHMRLEHRAGDRLAERGGDQARDRLGGRLTTESRSTIRGRDLLSGLPRKLLLTSEEVRSAIAAPLAEIMAAIHDTLEETPPELAADIARDGILLAGGGSLLRGFAERVEAETGMPAYLADSPLTCVAVGAGSRSRSSTRSAAWAAAGGGADVAVTARVRTHGLVLAEHEFKVPLDHAAPDGERSPSSRARSPTPTAATGRSSSSSRAARGSRRRARRATRAAPAGWTAR